MNETMNTKSEKGEETLMSREACKTAGKAQSHRKVIYENSRDARVGKSRIFLSD